MRKHKQPEERRNEIVEAAAALFLSKGYEKTAVSDIVGRVGVAQGLFYYYFKSKAEVLDAVVERIQNYFDSRAKEIVASEIDPVLKLRELFGIAAQNIQKLKTMEGLRPNSLVMHRLQKWLIGRMVEVISIVIEQGRRIRRFDCNYPKESARMIVMGLQAMIHEALERGEEGNYLETHSRMMGEIAGRLLGCGGF